LLVHYFDSTQTKRIDPDKVDPKLFLAWKDAVRGAVRHAGTLPEVDPQRIALLGFSLGACLSLAAAAEADPPVAATVELFGYLPQEFCQHARRLPPTLIVHGGADRVVPVARAHELEKLLLNELLSAAPCRAAYSAAQRLRANVRHLTFPAPSPTAPHVVTPNGVTTIRDVTKPGCPAQENPKQGLRTVDAETC
jgi:dienelactone hydrolase